MEMTLRNFVLALGVALLGVGFAGFAWPHLLGMHLTPAHNGIHIASGLLAFYIGSARGGAGARTFLLVFAFIYALLGVAGLLAPGLVARVIGHDGPLTAQALMADNLVHIALGAAAGIVALVGTTRRELPLAGLGRQVR
jgi:hypothetical protein